MSRWRRNPGLIVYCTPLSVLPRLAFRGNRNRKPTPHGFACGLGDIFQAVAEDLEPMTQETKGQLFEIFIPVFADTSDERVRKFRTLFSTDEILDVSRISKLINGRKAKFRLAIRGRPQLHKNQMLRSKSSHVRLKKTNSTSFG